jgi:hypothetical protein
MIQRRDGACLADESLAELIGDDPDRDAAAKAGICRLIDLPHPAGADWLDDLIGPELRVWRQHCR